LFHAVREDNEEVFVEVCGNGEVATLDINYMDGCAIWGQNYISIRSLIFLIQRREHRYFMIHVQVHGADWLIYDKPCI